MFGEVLVILSHGADQGKRYAIGNMSEYHNIAVQNIFRNGMWIWLCGGSTFGDTGGATPFYRSPCDRLLVVSGIKKSIIIVGDPRG